jgi:hypothetical protein
MKSPDQLAGILDGFLADSPHAAVLEDGAPAFDFAAGARYSVSTEHGKCVLHLWSHERNIVRRVVDAEIKSGNLRLTVHRFGQTKPSRLEMCRDRDRRSPSARRAARSAYQQRLRVLLERQFPGWSIDRLTTEMDLERSFGPIYTRGLLHQGRSAFAVLGVNEQESQASIDAALTFGLLWLDLCRERQAPRCHVEGLKLFVPRGTFSVVRERLAHLNHSAAKWLLYEVDEREPSASPVDCSDRGNISTRLVHCPDDAAARRRFAQSIARVVALVPETEVAVLSGAEIAFRLHGLEFARAQLAPDASFRNAEQIVFGAGPAETVLSDANAPQFAELLRRAREIRRADGPRAHPLWRMSPERWLEYIVIRYVCAIDERLDPACVYSQVPAFAASDRAMIDVLTCTRAGRLAVLELKADEDIHLPLQGLDYWARVQWHHQRGEFQRFGYFVEPRGSLLARQLLPEPPILLLVAPALHVHPATDTLLRYIAPEIDVTLVGIDERWREGVKVVFRKRAQRAAARSS